MDTLDEHVLHCYCHAFACVPVLLFLFVLLKKTHLQHVYRVHRKHLETVNCPHITVRLKASHISSAEETGRSARYCD